MPLLVRTCSLGTASWRPGAGSSHYQAIGTLVSHSDDYAFALSFANHEQSLTSIDMTVNFLAILQATAANPQVECDLPTDPASLADNEGGVWVACNDERKSCR